MSFMACFSLPRRKNIPEIIRRKWLKAEKKKKEEGFKELREMQEGFRERQNARLPCVR